MRKMLIAALAGALVALAVGVLTGAGAVGTDDESTVTETVTDTVEAPKPDEAGEDISGPCDEAEHANDPRCTGTTPADDDVADDNGVDEVGDDDEQAPAPAPVTRTDNSGPGSMNSGPGSVNSGRDHAEDDDADEVEDDDEVEIEDHSGPGHDGSDDHGGGDNSGPGGGDDD